MFAKSAMVAGRLLMVVVLTSSQLAHAQVQVPLPSSIFNLSQALSRIFSPLTADDKRKHHQAVLSAVSTLDNGEVIRWYSDTSYNHGIVEIVITSQLSGKLCRKLYTKVSTERHEETDQFWGCLNGDGMWEFFRSRH
jgi:surface antigen